MCREFRIPHILDGAVEQDAGLGRVKSGVMNDDAIALQRQGQLYRYVDGGVPAGGHVDGLERKLPAIALLERVVPKLGVQTAAAYVQRLFLRLENHKSV